jgi:hypothetical protein
MISVVIGNLYMRRIVDVLHHHKIRASVVGYAHKLAVIRTEQIPHRVWTSPSSPFSQTRLREQEARPGRLRHCTRFHTVMPRTHRRTATLEIFSWRSQTKESRLSQSHPATREYVKLICTSGKAPSLFNYFLFSNQIK